MVVKRLKSCDNIVALAQNRDHREVLRRHQDEKSISIRGTALSGDNLGFAPLACPPAETVLSACPRLGQMHLVDVGGGEDAVAISHLL